MSVVTALLTAMTARTAAAQIDTDVVTTTPGGGVNLVMTLGWPILLAVIFTLIGVVLFTACIFAVVRILPFSVRKEIEEDQNVALGIIIGSMILGIAIILAAAIMG